jgi:hypothetical protein
MREALSLRREALMCTQTVTRAPSVVREAEGGHHGHPGYPVTREAITPITPITPITHESALGMVACARVVRAE